MTVEDLVMAEPIIMSVLLALAMIGGVTLAFAAYGFTRHKAVPHD